MVEPLPATAPFFIFEVVPIVHENEAPEGLLVSAILTENWGLVLATPEKQTYWLAEVVTEGGELTVTEEVVLLHPVLLDVNVNATVPDDTPVTTPAFVTVAIVASPLVQVPPVVGDKVIELPTHSVDDGILTVGKAFTVTAALPPLLLQQPVVLFRDLM